MQSCSCDLASLRCSMRATETEPVRGQGDRHEPRTVYSAQWTHVWVLASRTPGRGGARGARLTSAIPFTNFLQKTCARQGTKRQAFACTMQMPIKCGVNLGEARYSYCMRARARKKGTRRAGAFCLRDSMKGDKWSCTVVRPRSAASRPALHASNPLERNSEANASSIQRIWGLLFLPEAQAYQLM